MNSAETFAPIRPLSSEPSGAGAAWRERRNPRLRRHSFPRFENSRAARPCILTTQISTCAKGWKRLLVSLRGTEPAFALTVLPMISDRKFDVTLRVGCSLAYEATGPAW